MTEAKRIFPRLKSPDSTVQQARRASVSPGSRSWEAEASWGGLEFRRVSLLDLP